MNMSVERISVESKQELEQMITKDIDQIEKDLTVICNNVPINDKTTLDVLCHDNHGQLVILHMSVNEDDYMLMQGIQSLDYVNKFKSFMKATYNKHNIDGKETPRLVLIAPSFSESLRHTVAHIQGIHIDLYEWEYLKIGDHKGLHLQSIFTWKPMHNEPSETEVEMKPVEKKHETKSPKKKEPAREPEKNGETEPKPMEEQTPEMPKPETEHPREEFSMFPEPPVQPENPKNDKDHFKSGKEEKKKLRLF